MTRDIFNEAARELPEGWEIRVSLERHCGGVSLFDPYGGKQNIDMGDSEIPLDQHIRHAIEEAKRRQGGY